MHLKTERGTPLWVFRVGFVAYWALPPFAGAGAAIARRRKITVYPLLMLPLMVVLTVTFTIGSVRYRAPAEIALVVLVAVGINAVFDAILEGRPERRTRPRPRSGAEMVDV